MAVMLSQKNVFLQKSKDFLLLKILLSYFKLLNRIVVSNRELHFFGLENDMICIYCRENGPIIHYLVFKTIILQAEDCLTSTNFRRSKRTSFEFLLSNQKEAEQSESFPLAYRHQQKSS